MATNKNGPTGSVDPAAISKAELRRLAEEIDCGNCAQTLAALSPEASWQVLHELRVYLATGD